MVTAKLCLALAVCVLVVADITEAHGKAYRKSAEAEEVLQRAENAEHLRSRLEVIARLSEAIMSQGDGEANNAAESKLDLNSCFGGYMATRCANN